MRSFAYGVLTAYLVVACRAAAKPEPRVTAPPAGPPTDLQIDLDPTIRDGLEIGFPLAVELSVGATVVGGCTVVFDLWTETYNVRLTRAEPEVHADRTRALVSCVDASKLPKGPRSVHVVVREAPAAGPRARHSARDTLF